MKRFVAYNDHGIPHVFDNEKMWVVDFSPSYEAAVKKAEELNREAENARMDAAPLSKLPSRPVERVKGIRI